MTQLEFLEDTINHYKVSNKRRCVNELGTCAYSPNTVNNKTSKGCAIGRHLSPEVSEIFDHLDYGSITVIMCSVEYRKLLPKWMQTMDNDFLQSIQSLHDYNSNWNKIRGLSKKGKEHVKHIKQKYNL
jgi:hypothetical protein